MPPDAPGGLRYSAVHWHPDYARAHPKGMGRKAVLLDEEEAAKYGMDIRCTTTYTSNYVFLTGMITRWNPVSTAYDGTPKVLAIPNYLGSIHCAPKPYERDRNQVSRPTSWKSSGKSYALSSICLYNLSLTHPTGLESTKTSTPIAPTTARDQDSGMLCSPYL